MAGIGSDSVATGFFCRKAGFMGGISTKGIIPDFVGFALIGNPPSGSTSNSTRFCTERALQWWVPASQPDRDPFVWVILPPQPQVLRPRSLPAHPLPTSFPFRIDLLFLLGTALDLVVAPSGVLAERDSVLRAFASTAFLRYW